MARSGIEVTPTPWRSDGDVARSGATVTWPYERQLELWVTAPAERASELAGDADPWVLALLHAAMREGLDLHVHGQVSPSLLANLTEYQAAIAGWSQRPRWPDSPRYSPVGIHADGYAERATPGDEVVCAFSGGLDSTFSLARHVRGEAGHASRRIGAALFVGGFDIPVADDAVFVAAAARARRITDDLGVPLVEARTNLRDLDLHWPDVFPGAVMALLSMFGGRFGAGMLATGRRWEWIDLPDDGSSPAWDWALGSRSFAAVHDGAAFDRPDKVAYLADWEAARRNVRVCWAGARLDRNCGRCRKCVGTYLLFRCLDVAPDCFDDIPGDDELAGLVAMRRPGWTVAARYAESLLATARSRGVDEPWVAALERSLFMDRRLDGLDRTRTVLGARARELRHRARARR